MDETIRLLLESFLITVVALWGVAGVVAMLNPKKREPRDDTGWDRYDGV